MSRPSDRLRHFLGGRSLRARRHLRAAGEDGFTLIELVIVLVILPLVIGGITIALITTLQDQIGVSTRLSNSIDSQLTSTYYVRDVQSAQYVTTAPSPGTAPWGTPTTCGSGPRSGFVLGLAWSNPGAAGETVVTYRTSQLGGGSGTTTSAGTTLTFTSGTVKVGYGGQGVVQTTTTNPGVFKVGTTVKSTTVAANSVALSQPAKPNAKVTFAVGPELVRDFCKGTNSPSTTTTSHNFFSPNTQAVVTCTANETTPKCHTPGPTPQTLAQGWVTSVGLSTVTLAVMEPAGNYDYNLTASPRVGASRSAGCQVRSCFTLNVPTLLALGGFQAITETGHSSITVLGTAVINSGYLWMNNQTSFHATTTIETTTTPSARVCTTTTGTGHCRGSCPTPTNTTPPATCHKGIWPWPPTHISTPVQDPFQGLKDPTAATTTPITTCPNRSATLSPGQYQCKLIVSGSNDTVTLAAGVYEFDTGVTVKGTGTLKATSDVLIYLPCNTAGTGYQQDTWATQCGESLQVSNGFFDVAGMISGTYAGLWFWENGGDHASDKMSGTGSLSATGILYAPRASVTLSGQATTTSVGAIVAKTFTVQNSYITVTGT